VEIVGRTREVLPPDGRGGVSGALPFGAGGGDTDRDQIADALDQCPANPETYNGFQDTDGCPDRGKVIIEGSNIVILDAIMFETGTARIRPESRPIIEAVVATLKGHPEFRLTEIAGYTDAHGNPARNQSLSEQRAQAVHEALVRGGIAANRLVARGYGSRCPRADNATPAGRDHNRRVEFKILETEDGPTSVSTCSVRDPGAPAPGATPTAAQRRARSWAELPTRPPAEDARPRARPSAVEGELARVRGLLAKGSTDEALRAAIAYRDQRPGDELAWVALGDCHLHKAEFRAAARAYGSLIDLAGDSAPKRRAAAGFLEAVERRAQNSDAKLAAGFLTLATDAYHKALERRRDHPSSHLLYARALAKQGKLEEAFEALVRAMNESFDQRFGNARALLAADLAAVGAAWVARTPTVKDVVAQRLAGLGVQWPSGPSLRFVLSWESDTSDVNLDVVVGDRRLSSERNGTNVRDGFGPEQIVASDTANLPYRVGVSYDRRGFQGYALGKVTIVHHDGAGTLSFDERPFVLMKEHGYADLGEFRLPAR
jgi:outer membrane protein OmpA-like peptidoglycan-associated protein/tetratricopeptide (TPR) repeat protein